MKRKNQLFPGDPGYVPDHEFGMFSKTHARKDDPETSKQAASGAQSLAKTHRSIVLNCLEKYKTGNGSFIAKKTGLTVFQVMRRIKELRQMGAVVDSGLTEKTSSGRESTVWKIVENVS